MKKSNLSSFDGLILSQKEMQCIDGGGAAGPPAMYWSQEVDAETQQESGEWMLKLSWAALKIWAYLL